VQTLQPAACSNQWQGAGAVARSVGGGRWGQAQEPGGGGGSGAAAAGGGGVCGRLQRGAYGRIEERELAEGVTGRPPRR